MEREAAAWEPSTMIRDSDAGQSRRTPADLVKLNSKIIHWIITYCCPNPCSWLSAEDLANTCGAFQSVHQLAGSLGCEYEMMTNYLEKHTALLDSLAPSALP